MLKLPTTAVTEGNKLFCVDGNDHNYKLYFLCRAHTYVTFVTTVYISSDMESCIKHLVRSLSNSIAKFVITHAN